LTTRGLLQTMLFCSLALSACSINISTNVPATLPPATPSALPVASAAPQQPLPATMAPAVTNMPITWANLHLTGSLVYTAAVLKNNSGYIVVDSLDLTTGTVTTIFQTPTAGWVDSAAVSPDGKQMVISFAAPASYGSNGQAGLFILPADGSKLAQPLFMPRNPGDQNLQVVWSPDGKYLYFAHLPPQSQDGFELWRVAYPGGTPEKLLGDAYWPRLSDDSSQLTYVTRDPQNGKNALFVAAADGTQPRQVPLGGSYIPTVIDVPMFSPDGKTILFSAPDPAQSSILRGLGSLLTIQLGHPADGSIPSDWWSVPVTGGIPKQLTHVQSLALYGSYSPDQQHIASYTANGIFVMNPDGTGVTVIVPDIGSIPGTVNWLP
jgi:Tol biopolymer transport system component